MKQHANEKQKAFSSEKPTYSEKEIIQFYYTSKRRHLDLNQLMRDYFCAEEQPPGSHNGTPGNNSIKEQTNNSLKNANHEI